MTIHPSHQKQLDRIKAGQEQANTFEAIAHEWLAPKDWEDVTKARRLAMLKRVVFLTIGKLPVRQLTPVHILDILNRTAKTGPPTVLDPIDINHPDRCCCAALRSYPHLLWIN